MSETIHPTDPRLNRPAEARDAVVLACDAGHLPYAWVVARQIDRLEPERRFDIVIASPDVERVPDALRDGPVRWVWLDVSAIPRITHPTRRITLGTFYRHLLPELLQGDYRALLYLDTDVWLRRPGVQGLFDRIAGDWPLAASLVFLHEPSLRTRASAANRRKSAGLIADLGDERGRFFQSGVMVMQTGPHVAMGIGQRTLAFAEERYDLLKKHRLGDQAAMNGAAAAVTRTLDPRWNWHLERWRRGGMVGRFDPYILHFAGAQKPWMISDEPAIAALNQLWFDELRRWDPGFVPKPVAGTAPWRAANPRFGVGALDRLDVALRGARLRWKYARSPLNTAAVAAMQALIDGAEVR